MCKVLIVDDDPCTLDTVAALLTLDGCTVSTASDGTSALALVGPDVFDIILLDLHLPDISGLDVVRSIRDSHIETPIVLVTAFPTFESSFEAGQLGVKAFVDGPIVGDEISVVIRRVMTAGRRKILADCSRRDNIDRRIDDAMRTVKRSPEVEPPALAQLVGLGESRLRHLFSESVGISLATFIRHHRLRSFARALIDTRTPIAKLARQFRVGNLNRAFRAGFGMPPSQYRESHSGRTTRP